MIITTRSLSLIRLCLITAFVALAGGAALHAQSTQRVVVTAHGAVGDGTTVNTKALQAAIDAVAARGGGILVVPRGTFLSGALYFKQGVDLHLEKDAILKSTTNQADFPPIYTRWEGIERYWSSAFLNFVGMKNVALTGEGLIDGSGDAFANFGQGRGAGGGRGRGRGAEPGARGETAGARGPATNGAPAPATATPSSPAARLTPAEIYGATLPTTGALHFAPEPTRLPPINAAGVAVRGNPSPPRAVVFQNCSNVRVSGVRLKNQARWGFVFIYCEDVVAEKLDIRAEHYIPSSDGIDVDSSRNVRIADCFIDVNDDCISLKSGKDEDGLRVARPCEDVVIERVHFAYGHGGAAMGSETSGGIRNVEVRDCIVDSDNWAPVRFKSQPSRGGVVENITYRNIELRGARQVFDFNMAWRMVPPIAPPAKVLPVVRNVKLINIHGKATTVGLIRGLPDSFIDGLTFENCNITAERGLIIENARNLDIAGLKITVTEGEPIIRR